MHDEAKTDGLMGRLNQFTLSNVTQTVLDEARDFFGKQIGLRHNRDDEFSFEPVGMPWRAIVSIHHYPETGDYKVTVELVPRELPVTHPQFIRITYDYVKQPKLQTSLTYRTQNDFQTMKDDIKKYFKGVREVMQKEAPRISQKKEAAE